MTFKSPVIVPPDKGSLLLSAGIPKYVTADREPDTTFKSPVIVPPDNGTFKSIAAC